MITRWTENELNEQRFNEVIPLAQECAVSGRSDRLPESIKAFNDVVEGWQQYTTATGSIQSGGHSISDGGRATYTRNTRMLKVSASDFIADVEVTARRVLSEIEFGYFKKTYLIDFLSIGNLRDPMDVDEYGRDKYMAAYLTENFRPENRGIALERDSAIRRKLGEAFKHTGIHPASSYFETQDVRTVDAIDVVVHEDGSRAVYEIKEERY